MKKAFLVAISVLFMCIFLTSCGAKTSNNAHTETMAESSVVESTCTPSPEPKKVEPLETKDFTVTDGNNDITLDTPYKDFNINYKEKNIDNNYVGETTSRDAIYKNYMHQFDDFDIYVSNTYYDTKNRNFDEYYLTQITLNTPTFKTARGITVGATIDEVMNLYGKGKKVESDGTVSIVYGFSDMELSFAIDKEQIVQTIILSIIVE